MKHSKQFSVELEGRYIKPPKLRREGKLELSTIHLIERLYVMRNAQDSEKCSTNGHTCGRKVWSADVRGEGAEQGPIAAYRTRDHKAKSCMCPSEVRHIKANDLVQKELLSLHGVLQPRMNIVLIVKHTNRHHPASQTYIRRTRRPPAAQRRRSRRGVRSQAYRHLPLPPRGGRW
jgi:hypothetical protein